MSRIRYNSDIGVWGIDRPTTSCTNKSKFCAKECYNNKLYKVFKAMQTADVKNEIYWHSLSLPDDVTEHFKRRAVKRLRLMSRGEAFSCEADIQRVKDLALANPDITIKIPTRAWREKWMRKLIIHELDGIKNLRIFASIDPSNTEEELITALAFCDGTLFFGDDNFHPYGEGVSVKCPKLELKLKAHCKVCDIGCYNQEVTKVHVHLMQH